MLLLLTRNFEDKGIGHKVAGGGGEVLAEPDVDTSSLEKFIFGFYMV